MPFTVVCNNCGNKQNITDLINNVCSNPSILIDLTFEDFEDHGNDNILFYFIVLNVVIHLNFRRRLL